MTDNGQRPERFGFLFNRSSAETLTEHKYTFNYENLLPYLFVSLSFFFHTFSDKEQIARSSKPSENEPEYNKFTRYKDTNKYLFIIYNLINVSFGIHSQPQTL